MSTFTLPCTLMRAGSSRGPFFLREWLPEDPESLNQALIGAIGASDPLQLDGLGGGSSLNSKVAIVSRSRQPDCDLDYLFAQVGVGTRAVDMRPNCGNMLSGVVPFAIEQGLLRAGAERTTARVFNVNTGAKIDVTVCTPGGHITYDGDARIDGVAGTAAPVLLNFLDAWGTVTGKLFPTGARIDVIEGIPVTCIDAAMPLMIVRASALGISGRARPAELDANAPLLDALERLRRVAGARMGLGDVSNSVVPKPVLVSEGDDEHSTTSRYFTPRRCHSSHAVTGAIGVATAFALPGTVASGGARAPGLHPLAILHPEGRIDVEVEIRGVDDAASVERAALVRTARKIMQGELTLPAYVFPSPPSPATASTPAAGKERNVETASPMRIIVPTSPGGANDTIARIIAEAFGSLRDAPVSVDYRAGAHGSIACHHVRAAAPDGRTLLLGYTATHGIHPAWQGVDYDPIADFTAIGGVCSSPMVLVVPAHLAIETVRALVEAARGSRRPMRYATSGRGTAPHFAAEMFAHQTGLTLASACFDGAAPAMAEVLHGGADLMFSSLYTALPHLRSGRLRALAVAAAQTLPVLPGVPTLLQTGIADIVLEQWYALFAPASTPQAIATRLNDELAAILSNPRIVARFLAAGAEVTAGKPQQLSDRLRRERDRWNAAIRYMREPVPALALD